MELYEQLLALPSDIKRDGSLAGLVEVEFSKRFRQDGRPKEYYYLTDLCNPMQSYWREKRPDVPRSREVANKLAKGNRLQRMAFAWMRRTPDYTCEETHLYGEYHGIDRVVGKFDMKLGDSIIEFKTKPVEVLDEDTVLNRYPQDLEQLLFYAALSPKETDTHYLVFQLDHKPHSLTVFKVVVKDLGMIRTALRQRRDNLDKAIEKSNPSILGKCRYYDTGCDYNMQGVCECSTASELSLKAIKNAVTMSIDENKRKELEESRANFEGSPGEAYYMWNLLTPRKHFLKCCNGISDDYESDESRVSCEEGLRKAVFRADAIKPDEGSLNEARARCLDLAIIPNWKWISVHGSWSGDNRRRVIPALLRVSPNDSPSPNLTSVYNIQLNIARIMSRNPQGAVIIAYPNAGDKIQAFTVSSEPNTLRGGEKMLRDAISSLDAAIKNRDINSLDLCPDWLQSKCDSCPDSCVDLAKEAGEPLSVL